MLVCLKHCENSKSFDEYLLTVAVNEAIKTNFFTERKAFLLFLCDLVPACGCVVRVKTLCIVLCTNFSKFNLPDQVRYRPTKVYSNSFIDI